jgi:hypothetical protein
MPPPASVPVPDNHGTWAGKAALEPFNETHAV